MTPSSILQASYLLTTATLVFLSCLPVVKRHLLAYGARVNPVKDESSRTETLLRQAASWSVPHSYFLHFYILSVLSSSFWGVQYATNGSVMRGLCEQNRNASTGMSIEQVVLMWALFAAQGSRRLVESVSSYKSSSSSMPLLHWLLGVGYYVGVGIAVWIEGADSILNSESFRLSTVPPSTKTIIGLPLFLLASGVQHDCHAYLASLKKYTLPTHPIFQSILCPHYTAECMIYVALSIISAPPGYWVNRTMFCVLIFVVANLSVTAASTREWYVKKFGVEAIKYRWIMFPGIW